MIRKKLSMKLNSYEKKRIVNEIKRLIISYMINDLVNKTNKNIKKFNPQSIADVRLLKTPLITFSLEMKEQMQEIREFLTFKMYKNFEINRMTSKAKRIVTDLFSIYSNELKSNFA